MIQFDKLVYVASNYQTGSISSPSKLQPHSRTSTLKEETRQEPQTMPHQHYGCLCYMIFLACPIQPHLGLAKATFSKIRALGHGVSPWRPGADRKPEWQVKLPNLWVIIIIIKRVPLGFRMMEACSRYLSENRRGVFTFYVAHVLPEENLCCCA